MKLFAAGWAAVWLCTLLIPLKVYATENDELLNQQQKLERLNQLSDQVYQHTVSEEFTEAKEKLEQIGHWATKVEFSAITSVEGMNAYIDTVVEAKSLFNSARLDVQQAIMATAKLRFATDALSHPNQPLWLNYYSVLKEDLKNLNQARSDNQLKTAQKHAEALHDHYNVIRPAILINRNSEIVEKMDSVMAFISKQVESELTFQSNMDSGLEHLKLVIDELFLPEKNTLGPIDGVPVPVSLTIGIASVIVTVLSFVAWKKFHAEKKPVF